MSTFVLYNGVAAGQRRTRVRATSFLETKSALEISDGELVIACIILEEEERVRLVRELTACERHTKAPSADAQPNTEASRSWDGEGRSDTDRE